LFDTAREQLGGIVAGFQPASFGGIVIREVEMFSLRDAKRLDELLALHVPILTAAGMICNVRRVLSSRDSLFSIRALSAAFRTISIPLVFLLAREAFAGDAAGADSIGAAAALLVAVNLRMIMHARMGRMCSFLRWCWC
jgi:hypothetical protein